MLRGDPTRSLSTSAHFSLPPHEPHHFPMCRVRPRCGSDSRKYGSRCAATRKVHHRRRHQSHQGRPVRMALDPRRPAMAEHSDIRHQLPRTTCERETHQSRSARPGVEFCSSYVQRRDNHIRRDPTYGGPIPGREGRRPVPERNLHGLEPTAGFGACARRIKCQLYPPLHP